MKKILAATAILMAIVSCSTKANTEASTTQKQPSATISRPEFNADSAYRYVADQVNFGYRIPGTKAHEECSRYLTDKLRAFGADSVTVQRGTVTAHTGENLPVANIFAKYNPAAKRRVLLAAHYDTRPWADNENTEADRKKPVLGANDGGSGVAVILEIARNINKQHPDVGVDIFLTDVEDYGESGGFDNHDDTWCLGTQYWVKSNPYANATLPAYGIVLDMVGGNNARFHREYSSNRMAREIVDKVWGTAANSPYAARFINEIGGAIVDDHIFINQLGIPCIDIVECNSEDTRSFPATWHTRTDDMSNIDRSSLKAVGETVMSVLYSEPGN